jgi:ligand-binding sensor domain-containing protein
MPQDEFMKKFHILLILSLISALLPFSLPCLAHSFDKSIKTKTKGTTSPGILKTDEFSLNTRNVKVIRSAGKILWIGTANGVLRYDTTTRDQYEIFDNQNVLLSNGIFGIVLDGNDNPWIMTYGGGLSHFDGEQWFNINTPQGLCDSFVYDLKFDGENTLWIATWSGANRVRGDLFSRDSWEAFTKKNTDGGLIDDWVYDIEIGEDGRVWFGTESGLSVYDGKGWKSWNHSSGLGADIEQVRQDNSGAMSQFEGTHHAGHAEDIPNIKNADYRPNYVVSMLLDPKGRLWIGTWGGGLSVFDTRTETFRNFTVQDGLPGNYILSIEEGPYGDLWIGSNGGLSRFDGETFLNYSKMNGLIGPFVFSIEFAGDHSLWMGSHSGMNRFKFDPEDRELIKID